MIGPVIGGPAVASAPHGRRTRPGPDGAALRGASSTPDYVAYHDEEWGRPVRDDHGLYERMCLEAFQSGLSWLTILRKREHSGPRSPASSPRRSRRSATTTWRG